MNRPGVICLAALLCAGAPCGPLSAQQRDSLPPVAGERVPGLAAIPDSSVRPPVSARRAFLYSLLLPGSGQVRLERPNAAALFVGVELGALAMARKSAGDLRYARLRARRPVIGRFVRDPATGQFVPADTVTNRFTPELIRARRTHLEDWYAVLAFNHLFAAADAFVAAQLWDLPAQVALRASPGRSTLVVSWRW